MIRVYLAVGNLEDTLNLEVGSGCVQWVSNTGTTNTNQLLATSLYQKQLQIPQLDQNRQLESHSCHGMQLSLDFLTACSVFGGLGTLPTSPADYHLT